MYYGYSSSDYIKDITTETKATYTMKYGSEKDTAFFSANITNNSYLKTEFSYSDKYSFASLDAIRNRKYIRINDEVSSLSKYLSTEFKEDLLRLSADRIVERYGTHVLTDFIIGGRYKLMFRSVIVNSRDASTKRKTVHAGFNVALGKIGLGYNLENSETVEESLAKENQSKELYVLFYGGNGTNLKYDLDKGNPSSVDIQSWENSVSLDNSCLTEIVWKETYPIYDFIADPLKKLQIKNAVIKYIESKKLNELKLKPLYLYFNDGYVPSKGANHYTTTLPDIAENFPDWKRSENLEGYILAEQLPGTIPLYEYYSNEEFDHYTTTLSNVDVNFPGWTKLRIAGYIYKDLHIDTTILYDYCYMDYCNHYTSTDPNICKNWPRWKLLNISGYVYPSN